MAPARRLVQSMWTDPTSTTTYELWKGDKALIPAGECIVVVTDTGKVNDRMFTRPADVRRWFNMSGKFTGTTWAYNVANYAALPQPAPCTARETRAGGNPNHTLVIMVALTNNPALHGASYLRKIVQRALNRAMNLPVNGTWRVRPTSICFDMIGKTPLGWTYATAAAAVVQGCEDWFNMPTQNARRRGQITTIRLMVPERRNATNAAVANNPAAVKAAWTTALDNAALGMIHL